MTLSHECTVGTVIDFEQDCILLDGEKTQKTGNQHGYQYKVRLKKGAEEKRKEDISKTGWKLWFMADTKSNTKKDYLSDDYAGTNNGNLQEGKWRLCGQQRGTVEHLLDGCRVLVNKEYLTWHKKALMTLVVSWAKEFNLVEKDIKWYKQKWRRGYILGNDHVKLVWDFELNLRKSTTSRRLDLNVIPIVIGVLGGRIEEVIHEVNKLFKQDDLSEKIVDKTQETILMDGENIVTASNRFKPTFNRFVYI